MATRGSASARGWQRSAVRRVRAARRATLTFLARLPEGAILEPRTLDRWSVKDVLGHLLGCDQETIRRLELIARGRGDRIRWFRSLADADRFNARCVARARRLGLAAVLRRMERTHADLLRRLARLPAASLSDPSHEYSVREWLPAPGWSHEREHLDEIRAWWRRRRKAGGGRFPTASAERAE